MEGHACVNCDIVFIGASVQNLLSAIALLERFEGIRIKILEASACLTSTDCFLTVLSSDAWSLLMTVSPRLCSAIQNKELVVGCGADALGRRCLWSNALHGLFLSQLPDSIFCLNQCVSTVHETADNVSIKTNTGMCYETKLLIDGGGTMDGISAPRFEFSGFVEIAFMTSGCRPDKCTEWGCSDMYIKRDTLQTGKEAFSCLMKSDDPSPKSVQQQLYRIPDLVQVLAGYNIESLYFHQLMKPIVTSSYGRISKSNNWSSNVPHFSPLKAEYESEEALLLIAAIEEKGLTAAALSDLKRRQTASSTTQVLRDMNSPLDLFSLTDDIPNHAGPSAGPDTWHHSSQVDHRIRDLGKPLICTHPKPYMALG